jgi:hypothetical protein
MVEPIFNSVVLVLDSNKIGGVMTMINMIAVGASGNDCSELLLQDLPSQGNLRIPTFFALPIH